MAYKASTARYRIEVLRALAYMIAAGKDVGWAEDARLGDPHVKVIELRVLATDLWPTVQRVRKAKGAPRAAS